MKKVFIAGSAGTTGLRIRERLAARSDVSLVVLPEEERKCREARRRALNACDIAFLCLPDAAAREAVSLVENPAVVVIDTSTAHRTAPDWTYGFPELPGQRAKIASSRRIANPGCHASGFVALVAPLVRAGLVPADARLSSFSLTGYSGGGKQMMALYEGAPSDPLLRGGRQYALGQTHKHLPEMVAVCGLAHAPVFSPVVVPHACGMEVTVPLPGLSVDALKDCYREAYAGGGLVRFVDDPSEDGFLSSAALAGRDDLEISVHGAEGRAVAVARFDNLGKGASGAAIQNMNLVLGASETEGLVTGR
jgi:N-acetyl-gamma-glutamyl-phosphate reductase